jgi:hypothetical protein
VSVRLRERVTEGLGIVAYANVARQDGHQLWRFAEEFGGRQMNGVQRTNRLDRKGPSRSLEDGVGDRDDAAPTLERPQRSERRTFLFRGKATRHSRPDDRSRGFGKRQARRDETLPNSQGRERRRILFQQSGEQRAALDVAKR